MKDFLDQIKVIQKWANKSDAIQIIKTEIKMIQDTNRDPRHTVRWLKEAVDLLEAS